MRADKYDPRYISRPSVRHVYKDFWDWLNQHPVWIIAIFFAPVAYYLTTVEV